jgi:hypothetical protein
MVISPPALSVAAEYLEKGYVNADIGRGGELL